MFLKSSEAPDGARRWITRLEAVFAGLEPDKLDIFDAGESNLSGFKNRVRNFKRFLKKKLRSIRPLLESSSEADCHSLGKPDISTRISYTHTARLRRGRQASTGAVTSVAMHAGPYSCGDRYQIAGKINCQL